MLNYSTYQIWNNQHILYRCHVFIGGLQKSLLSGRKNFLVLLIVLGSVYFASYHTFYIHSDLWLSHLTNSSTPPSDSKLLKWVKKRVPIINWLPKYTKRDVVADIISGLTVGLTMMPQSIAYASLAGVPPEYGLYTAFIGSFTYIFLGTIKEVSIGPTSMMALLTSTYTDGLSVDCVVLLTLLAGCMEFFMGVFKLGFLVDFISPPVVSGFTSANSVIIILAQLKNCFGFKIKSHGFLDMITQTIKNIPNLSVGDTTLAASCIIFLLSIKYIAGKKTGNKKVKKLLWFLGISKNAICVLIASLIAMYLHNFGNGAPFKLTGDVPQGMPSFQIPKFSTTINNGTVTLNSVGMVKALGSGIVVVPVAAVLANVAIAKAYASDVVVDATQEMITLGICNILGSCVQALPSCGAFTRSAVASSSDVRTPLQGLYSASVIILALSLLTPHFYYIPKATLAAVLTTAALTLIDYEILPKLWRTNKFDFALTILTFTSSVLFGLEYGILTGVAVNLIVLLKMWTRPGIYHEIRTLQKDRNYIYIKPELGLYYPSCEYLTEFIKKQHLKNGSLPLALDCVHILRIDYAGAKALQTLVNTYNREENNIIFLNVNREVKKTLNLVWDEGDLSSCQSTPNICDTAFTYQSIPQEDIPLVVTNGGSLPESQERKLSTYEKNLF